MENGSIWSLHEGSGSCLRRKEAAAQYREGLLKFGVISDAACNAVDSQLLFSREKFLWGKEKVPSLL